MTKGKGKIKDSRRVADFWTRKAQQQHFPARSVFKLEEIDIKHRFLKTGDRVIDLGCAPGSWTLYSAGKVGPGGRVTAVDIQPLKQVFPDNVRTILADVFQLDPDLLGPLRSYDLVLSDMAPKTTGAKLVDQARSLELAEAALAVARRMLKPGGGFLVKVFLGPDADIFLRDLAREFSTVRRVKPKSSRSFSPEIFGLGLGFKPLEQK